MSTWTLEYGEGPVTVADIAGVEQLDAEVDRITREAERDEMGWLVSLISARGEALTIGVGAKFSVISWFDEAADEAMWVDGDADGGEPSSWFYGNQPSEYPSGKGVLTETAREALREFMRTGQRPTLAWTDV